MEIAFNRHSYASSVFGATHDPTVAYKQQGYSVTLRSAGGTIICCIFYLFFFFIMRHVPGSVIYKSPYDPQKYVCTYIHI